MSVILAALDAGPTAQSTLEVAIRIGELTNTKVEAVHVTTTDDQTLTLHAEREGVPLRLLSGPLEATLLTAANAPDVVASVIGAKSMAEGRRLLGKTARYLVERSLNPVVIVPPELIAGGPFRRLLIPLEGTEASSRPVLEVLLPLLAIDVELIVIHVFTESTTPAMLDHPWRDLEILGEEFLTRHLPDQEASIELRHGPVADQVAEACDEHGPDLIVLSWSQDSRAGRAHVVRRVLGSVKRPILLLPLRESGPTEDESNH